MPCIFSGPVLQIHGKYIAECRSIAAHQFIVAVQCGWLWQDQCDSPHGGSDLRYLGQKQTCNWHQAPHTPPPSQSQSVSWTIIDKLAYTGRLAKCVLNNNWQLVFDDQSPCFQLSSSINASHNDRHTSANPPIMLRSNESVCSNHPTSSRLGPKDNLLSHLLASSSSSRSSSSPSGLMRARPQCRIYRWLPVELPRFVGGLCSLWYNPPISSFVHPCHHHHHHHCHHHI